MKPFNTSVISSITFMLYAITIQHYPLSATPSENMPSKQLFLMPTKDSNCYLSPAFFQYLITLFDVDILIETGTYDGGTIKNALPYFKEIHSIELSHHHYVQAKERFKNNHTAHLHHGDSCQVISKILPNMHGKILFWLDGHYSEGATAKGNKNTPILEELHAIKEQGITNAIILIDDMRCFHTFDETIGCSALLGYPTVTELYNEIKKVNPDYNFVIYGDIGLAFTANKPIIISPVIQACTTSRFSLDGIISDDALKQAEITIAHAANQEKSALQSLYQALSSYDPYNLSTLYRHWMLLIK